MFFSSLQVVFFWGIGSGLWQSVSKIRSHDSRDLDVNRNNRLHTPTSDWLIFASHHPSWWIPIPHIRTITFRNSVESLMMLSLTSLQLQNPITLQWFLQHTTNVFGNHQPKLTHLNPQTQRCVDHVTCCSPYSNGKFQSELGVESYVHLVPSPCSSMEAYLLLEAARSDRQISPIQKDLAHEIIHHNTITLQLNHILLEQAEKDLYMADEFVGQVHLTIRQSSQLAAMEYAMWESWPSRAQASRYFCFDELNAFILPACGRYTNFVHSRCCLRLAEYYYLYSTTILLPLYHISITTSTASCKLVLLWVNFATKGSMSWGQGVLSVMEVMWLNWICHGNKSVSHVRRVSCCWVWWLV